MFLAVPCASSCSVSMCYVVFLALVQVCARFAATVLSSFVIVAAFVLLESVIREIFVCNRLVIVPDTEQPLFSVLNWAMGGY